MKKRINYVSQLCITTELYRAIIKADIMPTEAKVLIQAVETGIETANKIDAESKEVTFNA